MCSSRSHVRSLCKRNNKIKKNEDYLRSDKESSVDNTLDHNESSHDDSRDKRNFPAYYINLSFFFARNYKR
jgi:hypothetical protein